MERVMRLMGVTALSSGSSFTTVCRIVIDYITSRRDARRIQDVGIAMSVTTSM